MKIIKRNGQEVTFSKSNIVNALNKANQKVRIDARLTNDEIKEIAKTVEDLCKKETHIVNVEDIQNFVEKEIMARNNHDVAKEYITYRYQRMLDRQKNTTDDKVLALLQGQNEEILQENANKNPKIASTMRDYMAGEMSKDISKRYLIPADIVKAHEEGAILSGKITSVVNGGVIAMHKGIKVFIPASQANARQNSSTSSVSKSPTC